MSKTLMWADIYGPKSFEECDLDVLSETDQALLRLVASTRESPNMLLYGPPGTGKTTIMRLLFPDSVYEIKEFNARKIKKPKDEPWLDQARTVSPRGPIAKSKSVGFCEQADLLPMAIQQLFRARLEDPGNDMTMVYTCSDLHKIDEYLKSRFMLIRFGSAAYIDRNRHYAARVRRCQVILQAEKVPPAPEGELMEIVQLAYPDYRQTINELQRKYLVLVEPDQG
jgi:DNA polymerase III delta prime subunit